MSAGVRPYMYYDVAMTLRPVYCRKLEGKIAFYRDELKHMRIAPLRIGVAPGEPSL